MNLGRIFAHAVVRRVAYVLVALVFGYFGLTGRAHAQSGACPRPSQGGTCTQAEAWQACQTAIAIFMEGWGPGGWYADPARHRCRLSTNLKAYFYDRYSTSGWVNVDNFYFTEECPSEWFNPETGACENPCSGKPPLLNVHALGDRDQVCSDGCAYECSSGSIVVTIDGVVRTVCAASSWNATGAMCSVGELPEPILAVTDSDGDGISDENDLSPNNPGVGNADGQESSRACGGPGQPECLPDGSNEGSGRGNTSSGGGDCNTPPRSSGDAILAQIAFQTWATRCAITAAANQLPGTGSGGGDGGDGDGSEMDRLRNEAAGLDTSLGDGDAESAWIEAPSGLDLDTGGLGIGGTCPAPPTINGVSIDPDNNLCMLVQIIGSLVLVGAFAHAGYIIGRS